MRKIFAMLTVVALFTTLLAGCAQGPQKSTNTPKTDQSTAQQIDWPKKPITLIVPYAAGGGTDLSARILKPYLEKELGVSVVVENKPGGGGWVGWSALATSKPDGYTIGYMNFPNVIAGYLNPSMKRTENLDSFQFIINHVVDAGVIAIRPDEKRFTNIKELVEYAKNNDLTMNTSGVGSANHFVGVQMNKQLGMKFRFVQTDGTAQAIPNVLGGHVDVLVAGISETMEMLKNGQLKPIAVFGSQRVPQLPDVPTINEAVGAKTEKFISRGIAGPKGIDSQIVAKLEAAFEKAEKNAEHIKKIGDVGMEVETTKGDAYKQLLKKQEGSISELKSVFGW